MTVLEQLGDAQTKIATVVLRAATASLIDDLERAVDDGVNAVRMLCKDPDCLLVAARVRWSCPKD